MVIKSATSLRNDYDKMVQISKEKQEAELNLQIEVKNLSF